MSPITQKSVSRLTQFDQFPMTYVIFVLFTNSPFEAAGAPARSNTKLISLGRGRFKIRNTPCPGGVNLGENNKKDGRLLLEINYVKVRV